MDAFLTYPGHFFGTPVTSVGAPIVVVPPESQVNVPPNSKAVAVTG